VDHKVGEPFTFRWFVGNTDALAKNVTVTGSLPAGLQFTNTPVPGEDIRLQQVPLLQPMVLPSELIHIYVCLSMHSVI